MKKLLITGCMVITLGMTLTTDHSQATTLLVDQGTLLGAKHVLVDEVFYNVTFEYGSFLGLYVGADGAVNDLFDFSTSRHAAQALLDQVLIDDGEYMFDSNPGPGNAGSPHIYTPQFQYEPDGHYETSEYVYAWITKNFSAEEERQNTSDYVYGYGTFYEDPHVWAVWVKPVPEPSTLLLLGVGLAGLIGIRLRKQKQM